ncbi:hypothetical protein MPSI1_000334 [Malassezia psittaci]|uniref:Uncharacterized protein n=1 Tax=Malassezia psittaci TaxID=1821823 RepID=A0AAF0JCT2_9BASI|nr:hypothetical protein MPSI1_000334 [Malassezia psittaci]
MDIRSIAWTLGDITNLAGSILTHQLLVQSIIASYMFIVDLCLCFQYLIYRKPSGPLRSNAYVTERSPLLITKYRHSVGHPIRATRSSLSSNHYAVGQSAVQRSNSICARASEMRKTSRSPRKVVRRSKTMDRSHLRYNRMADSTEETSGTSDMEASVDQLKRGRQRERRLAPLESTSTAQFGETTSEGESLGASNAAKPKRKRLFAPKPGTTRRGSSMVLLGLGVVFTFATTTNVKPDLTQNGTPTTVLNKPIPGDLHRIQHIPVLTPTTARHPTMLFFPDHEKRPHRIGYRREPLEFGKLLGRIMAWTCTLLYMTSRLPQIWTNYQRRSIKGLSVWLFVSAFSANTLYSISVLTNPKAVGPDRRAYLMESLPFLLGSGGTLVFDLVIIVQWWMWHQRR